ncbi:hypothetical protein SERLA73DRAFT_184834 [Serpula lacrymans var. lacrymans S7.3]|uniref:Uncharacterized protein n=2 Tax=Serpula lacrymans var. lacrymans TaxID=341189 RepID=F8Q572_SERL3|nr:uncharacterized protein SERLADRAFT_472982 [Serpula lacrymans var. lacrymans S7.9]EGN96699.1 hypothetical protein SERLA73DRAFT_184834 [Serpula lacrymans var. lacrymans S7.3]EGO22313.1 hypothetical protein SERLADRAFT_472982 [Serpula lacrymans var. lacrymans S7.9]
MSCFPHTQLHLGSIHAIVASGPHIQVLNINTGEILYTTDRFDGADKDAILKSGPVRCSAVNSSYQFLATVGDDKKLKVWEVGGLKVLSSRELPKRPTRLEFTKSDDILVSDKFGDVFRYPLHASQAEASSSKLRRDAFSSHENPSGGELILGHASLLTSFLLTADEEFIVTADRDEHIRVSWYPQGYNIVSYCLGHEKYLSALHIPQFSQSSIVSGGGDPTLKIWELSSGQLQQEIAIFSTVEPFIRVRPLTRKEIKAEYEAKKTKSYKENNGRQKQKGKEKSNAVGEDTISTTLDNTAFDSNGTVFVVHKISSLDLEHGHYLVFNAVGATAIFICPYPDGDGSSDIYFFDFGKPVIDFIIAHDGLVWTLLDSGWDSKVTETVEVLPKKLVRVVQWNSGKFIEVHNLPLLVALNAHCMFPASMADLKALDLYSDLSLLPKSPEVEQNFADRETSEVLPYKVEEGISEHNDAEKALGKRELGRLKHKRALQAHLQLASQQGDRPDDVLPRGNGGEPKMKKVRSKSEDI